MIKWFQNRLRGKGPREATLLDVAHEVLKKERVKTKVKKFLSFPLVDASSCEMTDEITETITGACEADPKIDRLFGES